MPTRWAFTTTLCRNGRPGIGSRLRQNPSFRRWTVSPGANESRRNDGLSDMQKVDSSVPSALSRRRNGIYYTPPLAAQVMAKWAIRSEADRVLEPCFGSGVFLAALRQVMNASPGQIRGVEMMDAAYNSAVKSGLADADHSILGDFLDVTPFQADVAIGNPPYVRLRSLPRDQEERARKAAKEALGTPMDSAGSVWMAFVLHATRFPGAWGAARICFALRGHPRPLCEVAVEVSEQQLWRLATGACQRANLPGAYARGRHLVCR